MLKHRIALACLATVLPCGAAQAQGYTPYDTYRDAYGAPHYSGNLTPAPDDRTVLGAIAGAGDPFRTRTRQARGWCDLDEIGQGFWEFRADRLARMSEDASRRPEPGERHGARASSGACRR